MYFRCIIWRENYETLTRTFSSGPISKRFFDSLSETVSILGISAYPLQTLAVCLKMINSICFQNPLKFERFVRHAFNLICSDVVNFGDITGTMHTLLVHGSQYIRHAHEDLGVAPGNFTENT